MTAARQFVKTSSCPRIVMAAALGMLCVALTACGGSGSPASSSRPPGATARPAPDTTARPASAPASRESTASAPRRPRGSRDRRHKSLRSASSRSRKTAPRGPPRSTPSDSESRPKTRPKRTPADKDRTRPKSASEGFRAQFQKFAQCLRDEGVDLPDLRLDGSGPPNGLNQIDRDDPDLIAAAKKCRKFAPQGRPGGPPG